VRFVDALQDTGEVIHGDGQRQMYLSAKRWPDGRVHIGYKGWKDGESDFAVLDDQVMGPTGGEYPVLVTDEAFYWIEYLPNERRFSGYYYRLDAVSGEVTRLIVPFPEGTSQGFAYWDYANKRMIWMDDMLAQPFPLARKYSHGGWDFGFDPHADRVLAVTPTGRLKVVANVYSQIGPRGVGLPDGTAVCCISNPHDQRTYSVHSSQFTEFTPAPPPEPVVWKEPPDDSHLDSIRPYDLKRATVPMRVNLSDHPDNPPDDFEFLAFGGRGSDSNALAAKAKAVTRAVPLVFYCDDHAVPDEMIAAAQAFKQSTGLEVWLSFNCYPRVGEDPTVTVKRCRETLQKAVATGLPVCPWLPLWRGINVRDNKEWFYPWTPQHALEITYAMWDACVAAKVKWVNVWVYTRASGRDGIVRWKSFQWAAKEMTAKAVPITEQEVPTDSSDKPKAGKRREPLVKPVRISNRNIWERIGNWLKTRFKL
jgi:hypothetical protein